MLFRHFHPAQAFSLLGPLLCLFAPHPAQAATMTPQQIVQRCQRAYDALHTYQGTASVTTLGSGGRQTYHTSARILFTRPNKIRATGTESMGGQFAYVTDGTATYEKDEGNWGKAKNTEEAIAMVTGIGLYAGTTIPALLLHTHWGNPFPRILKLNPLVGQETIGGVSCYRVTGQTPKKSNIYWIDSKTFLLKRYVFAFSTGRVRLKNDEMFSGERLNASIPTSAFALPAGH